MRGDKTAEASKREVLVMIISLTSGFGHQMASDP